MVLVFTGKMGPAEEFTEVTTGLLLVTVTVKLQVAVLPDASVARNELVVVPSGNCDPLGRPAVWVMEAPEQLSVTVGAV